MRSGCYRNRGVESGLCAPARPFPAPIWACWVVRVVEKAYSMSVFAIAVFGSSKGGSGQWSSS